MKARTSLCLMLFGAALLWIGLLHAVTRFGHGADHQPAADGSEASVKFIDKSRFYADQRGEISVRLDVLTAEGLPYRGLAVSQARVFEDDVPAKILRLQGPEAQFVQVMLVIDVSGSMAEGDKMSGAIAAAKSAVHQLRVDRDFLGVIAFDDATYSVQPLVRLSEDAKSHCLGQLSQLRTRGGTVIGRPTREAIAEFGRIDLVGPKLVIVMTDGIDLSLLAEAANIGETSDKAGVPVHTVGFGEMGDPDAEAVLRRLATECKGKYFAAPTPQQLAQVYREQVKEASDEYSLTYESPFPLADGLPRTMRIEFETPTGKLACAALYQIGPVIQGAQRTRRAGDEASPDEMGFIGRSLAACAIAAVLIALLAVPELRRSPMPTTTTGTSSASSSSLANPPSTSANSIPGHMRPPPPRMPVRPVPSAPSVTAARTLVTAPAPPKVSPQPTSAIPPAANLSEELPGHFDSETRRVIRPIAPPPPPHPSPPGSSKTKP